MLCDGDDGFLGASVPFVEEGVAAGQPVLVAAVPERTGLLRDALAPDVAAAVAFVDMAALGRNPSRIIPAWRSFVDEHGAAGRPVRGIGEPVWASRRPDELLECQLHESLLNLAVAPDTPLWLRCPYDLATLDDAVLAEVARSHPVLVEGDDLRGSTRYGGSADVETLFAAGLPEPGPLPEELFFDGTDLAAVRALVLRLAADRALAPERAADLALAVHEVATNSVHHGGGRGLLRVWEEGSSLVCEVRDEGEITDHLVGRRLPDVDGTGGRGLWLANQLCDLVQVRSSPAGTTVRLHLQEPAPS